MMPIGIVCKNLSVMWQSGLERSIGICTEEYHICK